MAVYLLNQLERYAIARGLRFGSWLGGVESAAHAPLGKPFSQRQILHHLILFSNHTENSVFSFSNQSILKSRLDLLTNSLDYVSSELDSAAQRCSLSLSDRVAQWPGKRAIAPWLRKADSVWCKPTPRCILWWSNANLCNVVQPEAGDGRSH